MAVVSVTVIDTEPVATRWEMPGEPQALRSPVPLGYIRFSGSDPIATLSSGDETSYRLINTMPPGFAYLPKELVVWFESDALETNFGNQGMLFYQGTIGGITPRYNFQSPGEAIIGAVQSIKAWVPGAGVPKPILLGGQTIDIRLSDMDASGSVAGDMFYTNVFFVFHVNQIDKWEVNTPIPTINHSSF